MQKKTSYIIATAMLLTYITMLFFCCLYDFSEVNLDISNYLFGIRTDRLIHATMFFPYPFIAWIFFNYNGNVKVMRQYLFSSIILSGLFLASLAESSQELLTTWRDSDPFDLGANISGILIGSLVVYLLRDILFKLCHAVFKQ
jgi:hypothetical protein